MLNILQAVILKRNNDFYFFFRSYVKEALGDTDSAKKYTHVFHTVWLVAGTREAHHKAPYKLLIASLSRCKALLLTAH